MMSKSACAILGSLAISLLCSTALAEKELTVAVFKFESLDKKKPRAGEGASDAVVSALVKDKTVRVVEEAQLNKAIDSLARNQMGLFREDSALEVGNMVDARYIIIGSVDFLGGKIAINARVLDVETRELLVAERTHGSEERAFEIYDSVAKKLNKNLAKHLARRITRANSSSNEKVAVNELVARGKRAMKKNDLPGAVRLFSKAVVRNPKSVRARIALGHAFIETGNFHDAKVNLDKAVEYDEESAPAYTFLGYAEDKLGNTDLGRQYYETAIELDPKFALARFYLAANLANAGAPQEARLHAKMAKKLGHKRAAGLLRHIDVVIARERTHAAER